MSQGRSLFTSPEEAEPEVPRQADGSVLRHSSILFHDEAPYEAGDALGPAGAKAEVSAPRTPPRRRRRLLATLGVLGAVLLVAALVALPRFAVTRASPRPAPKVAEAALVVESSSAGWHVWDGEIDRGATPLTLALPPGQHTLMLRRGTMTRRLQVDLAAGARVVHHLDLPEPPPTGDLHVATTPPGAIVAVDGEGRGVSPVDVRDLKAGRHVVTLLSRDRVFSQAVTVEAGGSASLVVPLAEAGGPAVGWVSVKSAIDLEVFDGESLVGSSRNARVLFMPGRHALRLVNRDFGFETTRFVQIQPGVTATLSIVLPNGSLSINAAPWAEVLMDGAKIGETPIANFAAPIGSHEIVLRHPKYGEQRRKIVVSQGVPVRLGVDLRQ